MEGKTTPYSGIDRVNTRGNYEPGNILPCCQFCNFAKAAHPLEFFIEQLNRYGSSVTVESVLAECYLVGELLEALPAFTGVPQYEPYRRDDGQRRPSRSRDQAEPDRPMQLQKDDEKRKAK